MGLDEWEGGVDVAWWVLSEATMSPPGRMREARSRTRWDGWSRRFSNKTSATEERSSGVSPPPRSVRGEEREKKGVHRGGGEEKRGETE